jgi:branched-chain amino acid aminotransferase
LPARRARRSQRRHTQPTTTKHNPRPTTHKPARYANTHKSTGFDAGVREDGGAAGEPLPDALKPLLGECWPAFELLRRHALRTGPLATAPPPPRDLGPADAAAPPPAARGTHAYVADPRNADVLVGIRDGVTGDFDLARAPARCAALRR